MGKHNSTPSVLRGIRQDVGAFLKGKPQHRSVETEEQYPAREDAKTAARTAYNGHRKGRTSKLSRPNRRSRINDTAENKTLPPDPGTRSYNPDFDEERRGNRRRPESTSPIRRARYEANASNVILPPVHFGQPHSFPEFQGPDMRRRNQSSSPIRRELREHPLGSSFQPFHGTSGDFEPGIREAFDHRQVINTTAMDRWESEQALDRIFHRLHAIKEKYPTVPFASEISRPQSSADVEVFMNNVIEAFEHACWSSQDWERVAKQLEIRCSTLQAELENSVLEIRRLTQDLSQVVNDNENGQVQNQELRAEIAQLKQEGKRKQEHIDELGQRMSQIVRDHEQRQRENERKNGQFEGELFAVKEQHNVQEQKHDNRIKKMLEDAKAEKKNLVDDYDLKLQRLKSQLSSARNKHESDIVNMRAEYEQKLTDSARTASEEVAALKRDLEGRLAEAERSMTAAKERYEIQIERLRHDHEDAKLKLSDSFAREEDNMKLEFANMKTQILFNHKAEKERMEKALEFAEGEYHKTVGEMKQQFDQEIEEKDTKLKVINDQHGKEKAKMRADHEVEKKALTRSLQESVEVLKGALVKRDHFKAMSDHELSYRFQEISSEVDDIARLEWDNDRISTWPLPEKILRSADNKRRLKQYIVQNTFWVILYERIFCTPFRVLGIEGRTKEGEWLHKYGAAHGNGGAALTGPKATKDSEKWRFETMKICVEAIGKPLMEGEPNYNVRQAYEQSLREVTESLYSELGKVSSATSSDKQRMADLVRKSAKLWLEVGQQRYRLFLLMSESGREPRKSHISSLDQDGKLELIVLPEVRRMGNAQGERLDKDEMVLGCKGKFSHFPST